MAWQQMGEPVCQLDVQESKTATFETSPVPPQKNVTLVPELTTNPVKCRRHILPVYRSDFRLVLFYLKSLNLLPGDFWAFRL